MHEATIFAVLDLAQSYLQMPLADEAKEKTAFITQDETGQFERAMFSLINAPFYIAKMMKLLFCPKCNNILVYAQSWQELLVKIGKILVFLMNNDLCINAEYKKVQIWIRFG